MCEPPQAGRCTIGITSSRVSIWSPAGHLDAEAQRILQGLEEKGGEKIGIGKFRTAAVEKNKTLGSFAPSQAATEKKGVFTLKGRGGGGEDVINGL